MVNTKRVMLAVCVCVCFYCTTLDADEPPFAELAVPATFQAMQYDRDWYEAHMTLPALVTNDKFHRQLMLLSGHGYGLPSPEWPRATVYWLSHRVGGSKGNISVSSTTWRSHVIDGQEVESFSTASMGIESNEGRIAFPLFGRLYEFILPIEELRRMSVRGHIVPVDNNAPISYGRCIIAASEAIPNYWYSQGGFQLRFLIRDEETQEVTIRELPGVGFSRLQFHTPKEGDPDSATFKMHVGSIPQMMERLPENYDGYRGKQQSVEFTVSEGDVIEVPNHPLRFYVKEIVLPDPKHDPPIYGWVELLDYIEGETPPQEALEE